MEGISMCFRRKEYFEFFKNIQIQIDFVKVYLYRISYFSVFIFSNEIKK